MGALITLLPYVVTQKLFAYPIPVLVRRLRGHHLSPINRIPTVFSLQLRQGGVGGGCDISPFQYDRSGGGTHRWRDGRIVPGAERRVQGATIPNHLCDHSGRDFAQSSSVSRLSLRDRQAARGREEESGGLRPLAWGGNVDED